MEKRWIWPFELLDKLGEGGMGVVYRARYVVDNRHVAVKLLPPNIANETILSRFERELEILKTLRHPNIVRCFGGKCEGNQHFYAMELVEGGTLDRLLEERSKFTAEAATQFALQMASGLSYAHERGVVHRDVKPGNFLLTPTGKIKLSDFGLATVEAAAKITAAGKTMGTFPYMAPEQIRGRPPVSAQTDLYALGCVIFEMLTGRTPFTGETPAEVMHKHLDQAPPKIAEFTPDCPLGLESLVRDLLQKEPTQRPESAYVVAQRLTDLSGSVETTAPKVARTTIGETSTVAAVPRGIVVSQRPLSALRKTMGGTWLIPALAAILSLSLIWNVWSLVSSASQSLPTDLWIKAFQTDQTAIREEAAKALGEMAETSPAALHALVAALDDERTPMRTSAIEGLMVSGSAGRAAIPKLSRLKNSDVNEQVRRMSAQALLTIQQHEGNGAGGSSWFYWLLAIVFVAGIIFAAVMLRRGEEAAGNSR